MIGFFELMESSFCIERDRERTREEREERERERENERENERERERRRWKKKSEAMETWRQTASLKGQQA